MANKLEILLLPDIRQVEPLVDLRGPVRWLGGA
jgi:hypothetical protein